MFFLCSVKKILVILNIYDMELYRMQVVLTFAKNLEVICVKLCSLSSKDSIPSLLIVGTGQAILY